ncbi:diadenosine 5',5'''-P1,P4-tetraphosphate asymmetrical hydrolase [Cylindrobasidium torrendii FP15055 ss-10]|uniref:Diadenosine 5',5'''-P1,P4-tetraphosphate asymmetrical hydrolase n=1 Tax=Cylindrobasidium torrendii FP15055 ss-10 TaxID=1314674 RepID=A0A0D7BV84_9AGAR|nr:diadenosine 5',5'''-P1,P4-tetraphosphate asymmetrical hydrolase [Cylindrobasidium torrendii FP15055 ss-10]
MASLFFSTIEVTKQAFFRTPLRAGSGAFAIVNLKPIVPGHVLVIPTRVVLRLADLQDDELTALMLAVKRVGCIVERAYKADGLTVACQDGKAAGQSVPHVHFHIMPRKFKGDRFEDNNDAIYPELERSEGNLADDLKQAGRVTPLHVDADDSRPPRTMEEMEKEASWLSTFL